MLFVGTTCRSVQTERDISGLREKLNQIIDSHNMISEEIEQLTSEVGEDGNN